MGRTYCCVVNCKNTSLNSKYKFYKFPRGEHTLIQGNKWITAVNRTNPDGSLWIPKKCDKICSSHFIGNQKSENQLSPSYVPTIFPDVYNKRKVNESAAINRHKRFMKRRTSKEIASKSSSENIVSTAYECVEASYGMDVEQPEIMRSNQECQVNIFSKCTYSENSFTCNRYIYEKAAFCDAEVQTEILDTNGFITLNVYKKFKNKNCGTPVQTFVNKAVGPD